MREFNGFNKLLFLCSFLTFLSLQSNHLFTAPLHFVSQRIIQPDGTLIKCYASGDEFYNWLHDSSGYTIVQNKETGYYVYGVLSDNKIVSSEYIIGKYDPEKIGIDPWLKISEKDYSLKKREKIKTLPIWKGGLNKNSQNLYNSSALVPREGIMNMIVVFIRFSDDGEFNKLYSMYENLFNSNSANDASLLNYYKEASYNKLTLASGFYPSPTGNSVVSYEDDHPRGYYRIYNAATNPAGYDPDIPNSDYQNPNSKVYREHTLLKNAIQFIGSEIPDGFNIDADNDDVVDNICFVINGSPDGWNDLLWPHQWSLWSQEVTLKNKIVYAYNFQLDSELTLGVLCHENFHVLGAPDLYHYSQDEMTPVGPWDLMEWNYDIPQHMCGFMKYRYGGWIEEIPEIKENGTYTLSPLTSNSGNVYKIQSPHSLTEYFVLEYRKRESSFENSIPGEGLLVYRINQTADNKGNREGPPDEVYLFRPGGSSTSNGDVYNAYFCQSKNRVFINDNSDPKCFLQDGTKGGLDISNIGFAGDNISFDINFNFTPREFLQYDKGNYDAIGTNQAGNFHAAVKFSPTELSDIYGSNLTDIMLFIQEGGGNDVVVKVWKGSSSSGPKNVIYEQNIANEVKPGSWTIHTLSAPLALEENEDYWIGYQINATGGLPMGIGRGPLKAGKGGWINIGDGWKQLPDYGLDGNWNIRGVAGKGAVALAAIDVSQLNIEVKPEESASTTFNLQNAGGLSLNYSISSTGGDVVKNIPNKKNIQALNTATHYILPKNSPYVESEFEQQNVWEIDSEDILYLDDGDDNPDTFIGSGNYMGFAWANKFDLAGFGFDLKKIQVHLRSESSMFNSIGYTIYNGKGDYLYYNSLFLENSVNGGWYEIQLDSVFHFNPGESFYIQIESYNMALYPAGYDLNASIKDQSFYSSLSSFELTNMNTIPEFANGAFLIRAVGSKNAGTQNQPPVAKGAISKNEAAIGELLIFDASESYDPDGQISSYLWEFGDGSQSSQMTASHSYNITGEYNIKLKVTDNLGAVGLAEGIINIVNTSSNKPPNAVAQLSKQNALINEEIVFDGSQSYDDDGQIASYLWEFGDGYSAQGSNVTHSYSNKGTYYYKLTVVDDKNAIGEASGNIIISDSQPRFVIAPSEGILEPGKTVSININFNSAGLSEGNYTGQINVSSNGGDFSIPVNILISHLVDVETEESESFNYTLSQNYPNPFNPSTKIDFSIAREGYTRLVIYDALGNLIKTLVEKNLIPGNYSANFNASGLSSGVYFCRLKSDSFVKTNKLIFLK